MKNTRLSAKLAAERKWAAQPKPPSKSALALADLRREGWRAKLGAWLRGMIPRADR